MIKLTDGARRVLRKSAKSDGYSTTSSLGWQAVSELLRKGLIQEAEMVDHRPEGPAFQIYRPTEAGANAICD